VVEIPKIMVFLSMGIYKLIHQFLFLNETSDQAHGFPAEEAPISGRYRFMIFAVPERRTLLSIVFTN